MPGADRAYIVSIVLLIVAIGAGVYCLEQGQPFHGEPLELSGGSDLVPGDSVVVRVDDSLPHPGVYTLPRDTTLGEIQDITNTSSGSFEVVLRATGADGQGPQRIDLNCADTWLLEALPGIGEKRAAAIVDYREKHGGFRAVEEVLFVDGIGPLTYEGIEELVTVTAFASDVASVP